MFYDDQKSVIKVFVKRYSTGRLSIKFLYYVLILHIPCRMATSQLDILYFVLKNHLKGNNDDYYAVTLLRNNSLLV